MVRNLLAIAALAVGTAAAAQSGWTPLGRDRVGDGADRGSIESQDSSPWSQIILCVEEAPVRFGELVIRSRNGVTQNIRLRELVRAGGCSREIGLRGRREIQAVDFSYDSASLEGGRARIDLFAR